MDEALRTIIELERIHGFKIDAILPDGTHRYWSTHCRHTKDIDDAGHEACSATEILGELVVGPRGSDRRYPMIQNRIGRKPAQCKTCAARCVCPCHGEAAG